MSPISSKPSWPPATALALITIGALLTVWSVIGGVYFLKHPPENRVLYYVGGGILGTGLVLLIVGLSLGRIARSARRAEVPPSQAETPTR